MSKFNMVYLFHKRTDDSGEFIAVINGNNPNAGFIIRVGATDDTFELWDKVSSWVEDSGAKMDADYIQNIAFSPLTICEPFTLSELAAWLYAGELSDFDSVKVEY